MIRLKLNLTALAFGFLLGGGLTFHAGNAHAQATPTGLDVMSVPGMVFVCSLLFAFFHGFKTGFRP